MGNYSEVVNKVENKDEKTIKLLKSNQYSKGKIHYFDHFSKKIIQNEKYLL
jgi:hypothetical protein